MIIFSPVYSKHANGEFIDKSVSMLNVAVSRAKDSFLVFGDMDVFEVVSKTKPRGLLASLLFQSNAKGLNFEHRRRPDLKTPRTEIRHLRDAQQHDAFLLNALANVGAEIQIVTPWIRLECVENIGAMDAMGSAVKRGVAVGVYTDPEFNTDVKDPQIAPEKRQQLLLVEKALRERGTKVSFVRRVHSKAVMGDEDLYCVGSFNWFSARRDNRHARHETSLVYRGPDLAAEIRVRRKSLTQRITHYVQSAGARASG